MRSASVILFATAVLSAEFDRIELSGTQSKGAGAASFEFEFNISSPTEREYKIIAFNAAGTGFADDDFAASYKGMDYGVVFGVRAYGIYAMLTIPEPSQIAALFALIALLFAVHRRGKRKV